VNRVKQNENDRPKGTVAAKVIRVIQTDPKHRFRHQNHQWITRVLL